MQYYFVRRVFLFFPTAFLVSLAAFLLMQVLPGDAALVRFVGSGGVESASPEELQRVRHELGLDRPLYQQYESWVWDVARLDLGKSAYSGRAIMEEIRKRLPVTMELAFFATICSVIIAIPLGIISAIRQNSWLDYLVRVISISGLTLPTFWSGTLVLLALVILFNYSPPILYTAPWQNPWINFQQMAWPILILGYYFSAVLARMTRSSMLEVLRQDYVRTARAKGLRERVVLYRHALKNALLPIVTLAAIQFGVLLGGTVVMEQIFALPGLGTAAVDAIAQRDFIFVQDVILLLALAFLTVNLMVDVLYAWLDPRIRYA